MKVKVIGQRSRSPCQKCDFHGFCIVYLTSDLEVKGLSGQCQRPHRSRSKVTVANKGRCAHINVKLLQYFQRPEFCPVSNLTDEDKISIPEEIRCRGVDVGSVAIVESCDGRVLLIRRPLTQRTFPGVWVPPGGHVEANETVHLSPSHDLHLNFICTS